MILQAAIGGHHSVVEVLLARGAVAGTRNREGATAAELAATEGIRAILRVRERNTFSLGYVLLGRVRGNVEDPFFLSLSCYHCTLGCKDDSAIDLVGRRPSAYLTIRA
jgi:hypothetical protein